VLDGGGRATAPAALHLLAALGALPDPLPEALSAHARPTVTNAAGQVAGYLQAVEPH
jgi:L-asparaginase II